MPALVRAQEQVAGTVALVSGKAWIRHGEINLSGTPGVVYTDKSVRELGPNDPIAPGDLVHTSDDTYLKIYYKDDSIMDIGPNSTFKVTRFQVGPNVRNIAFQLLGGKLRTLVTRSLEPGNSFRVMTPISSMGVHGTEWVTHSYLQNNQYRTDVTVLEGKVVVDIPKAGSGGRPRQTESVAVTPGRSYSGIGVNGTVSKYNVAKLTAPQISEMMAMIPNIETKRIGPATTVTAASLPGTGLTGAQPPGPPGANEAQSFSQNSIIRNVPIANRGTASINSGSAPAISALAGNAAFMPQGSGSRPGGAGGAGPSLPGAPAAPTSGGAVGSASTAATAVIRQGSAALVKPGSH